MKSLFAADEEKFLAKIPNNTSIAAKIPDTVHTARKSFFLNIEVFFMRQASDIFLKQFF